MLASSSSSDDSESVAIFDRLILADALTSFSLNGSLMLTGLALFCKTLFRSSFITGFFAGTAGTLSF